MPEGFRVLVAGIGNVLRGDDGFGPAVARALEREGRLPAGARVVELGIGGVGIVHELLAGFDALIVIDAVDQGGSPGVLYVIEPKVPEPSVSSGVALGTDMHEAVPVRALTMARAVGALPEYVRIVGCQPAEIEELSLELSPTVQSTVSRAVEIVRTLMREAEEASTCQVV